MVGEQVSQLNRLINELLDLTRIARDKITLRPEVVKVALLVGRASESVRPFLEQRQQEIVVSVEPDDLVVKVDQTRFEQILINLLSNAAKYSPPSSTVRINVRHDGDVLSITVEDDGIGISEADLSRVFESFAQVSRGSAGLGIGLSLVRRLVELHGGTITAESAGLGHGTCMRVLMPLRMASENGELESGAKLHDDVGSLRVLVVDDHADAATALSFSLGELGLFGQGCDVGLRRD